MIETGTLNIKQEECDLRLLLQDIHKRFEKQIKGKEKKNLTIHLKKDIKDDQYTLLTDENRLRQVLVNLIENAISFTDEGTIDFGCNTIDQESVEFFVKDTGTGISPERLEKMLHQCISTLDERMRPVDMVSLRINIIKHIIRLLGSELKAESKLGHGSDFRFALRIKNINRPEDKLP